MKNFIPKEIAKQVRARARLISEMQSNGAISTPVSYLETPALLVMSMDADYLDSLHKKLKRTRKRGYTFGLNGRTYVLTRRESIALVVAEINARAAVMANV